MLRDATRMQVGQQLGCRAGRGRMGLAISARHPSKATQHRQTGPGAKKTAKKRDISTSFRRGPVPRPLVNHTSGSPQQQPEGEDDLIIGIPPPAASSSSSSAASLKAAAAATTTNPAVSQAQAAAPAGLSLLGEPCRIGGGGGSSSRASSGGGEPVIALAATAMPVLTAQDLGLLVVDDSPVSTSDSDADSWAEADDPLASFDRVLDGLLVAPVPQPATFTTPSKLPSSSSSSPSTNSFTLGSLLPEQPFAVSSTPAAGQALQPGSAAAGERRSRNGKSARLAAAAAAPAVTVVHCETEFEREQQAAAALQQLLVVKFESSQHLGGSDSSLRFQTHSSRPTPLNTYMPHSDISAGFGFYAGGNSASSSSSGPGSSSTTDVLASMGINLGAPSSSSSTGAGSMGVSGSLFGSPSSSDSGEPFSPVHAWYKQLAVQYAHSAAAAGQTSPVRFLSVQCDGARARAVARRLGVSAPLAVALVNAASGRKLQEVIGAKIQTELPNGLLYFGGSDPQGLNPAEQLVRLNTEADLEALKSSSQLSVAAFHVHGAPPCVRSYARMYAVAQQYAASPAAQPAAAGAALSDAAASPCVAFGVMDVDAVAADEGGAVSSKLGLQQLPTYIVYKDGQEVARLSSSPDRRRLAEVLAQQVAAVADAAAGSQQ